MLSTCTYYTQIGTSVKLKLSDLLFRNFNITMVSSVMTLGAVGHKIELGMLWDGHNYCTLGGLSLWDSNVVEKQQIIDNDIHTEFDMQVTDEERRKAHKLDVEASLSATIGLFKLEGSAKYLNDKKTSKHEAVVTVTAFVRTRTRRIPQEVLASIGYKSNLDLSAATHFVAEVMFLLVRPLSRVN